MVADTQYNDFRGSASADISDSIGQAGGDDLKGFSKFFELDETRFRLIGISLYGPDEFSISLLCIDLERSSSQKEHIVSMMYDMSSTSNLIGRLFKRLHIVLHNKFDEKYPSLDYNEEVRYSDFHESKDQ